MTSYTPPRGDVYRHENDQHQPMTIARPVNQSAQPQYPQTALGQQYSALLGIRDEHSAAVDMIGQKDWDATTKTNEVTALAGSTDYIKRIRNVTQASDQVVSQVQADFDAGIASKRPNVTDIASEYAARTAERKSLDALQNSGQGRELMTGVNLVANAGDDVATVYDTVKPWLENRGHSTEAVDRTLARTQPDLAAKAEALRKAKQANAIVHQTASQIERGIIKGTSVRNVMPAEALAKYDPEVT
jgi:hypothetical protein